MKRFLLMLPLLAAAVVFSLAGGCSKDDSGPTEPNNQETGLDSAGKAFIDSLVDENGFGSVDMTMSLTDALMDSLWPTFFSSPDGRGMPVQLAAGEDSIIFEGALDTTYSGEWWVINYTATIIDTYDGTSVHVVSNDSIQFLAGATPMQYPDSTVTAFNIRNHATLVVGDSLTWGRVHHALNFAVDFDAVDPTMTLNGSGNDTLHATVGANGNCDLTLTNGATLTDVVFETGEAAGECPTSGSMSMSFTIDLSCSGIGTSLDTLNINGSWTITATFANGVETINFNDGTTSWSKTQECGGTPGDGDPGGEQSFVSDFFAGGDLLENIFKSLDVSFALLEDTVMYGTSRLPNAGFAAGGGGDTIIVGNYTYIYSGGWHIFDFNATVISQWGSDSAQYVDTTDLYGWDSVQTLVNGQSVQYPTMDNLSEMIVHAHVNWSERSMPDSGVIQQTVTMVINSSNPPDTIITFNATANDTIWESEDWMNGECEVYAAISQTVTDLSMNVSDTLDNCPLSGAISVTATLDVFCTSTGQQGIDSLSISGTWSIDATVNSDNTITVTYDDGTTNWTATGPCNSDPGAGVSDRSPWMSFRD